jgi:hypothetical protein
MREEIFFPELMQDLDGRVISAFKLQTWETLCQVET